MNRCNVTPSGWARCTRISGHDGPCAHWPKPSRNPNIFTKCTECRRNLFLLKLRGIGNGRGIASKRFKTLYDAMCNNSYMHILCFECDQKYEND